VNIISKMHIKKKLLAWRHVHKLLWKHILLDVHKVRTDFLR